LCTDTKAVIASLNSGKASKDEGIRRDPNPRGVHPTDWPGPRSLRFKMDYVKADGDISKYYSDFIVRRTGGEIWERLQQWCADASAIDSGRHYRPLFVREEAWDKFHPSTFKDAIASFSA